MDFIKTDRERALEKACRLLVDYFGPSSGYEGPARDALRAGEAALAFAYAPPDEPAEGTVYIADIEDIAPPVAIGPKGYEHDGDGNPVNTPEPPPC